MKPLPVFLLLALLSGCQHTQSPEAPRLVFTTDRAAYTPGADVELHLQNHTDQTIGYNLCFSALEQQTDQGWQPVADSTTVCTTIQHGLQPGDSTSYTKTLVDDLPEGTYRFMTEVEHRDTGRQESLATQSIVVES